MRRSTGTSEPLDSPARTMLTYRSEKIARLPRHRVRKRAALGHFLFQVLLTSAGIPLVSRCVMLFSATVNGIPEFSKFANCVVNVASSCNFGLRFCDNCACIAGGKKPSGSRLALPACRRQSPPRL